MRRRLIPVAGALTLAAALLLAACGGDSGNSGGSSTSEIHTQRGLSVAAISQNTSGSNQHTSISGGQAAQGALPASLAQSGKGVGGTSGYQGANPMGVNQMVAVQQAGNNGITVMGFGSATANADTAVIEFYLGTGAIEKPIPVPEPQGGVVPGSSSSGSASPLPGQVTEPPSPITEAQLQPVIDAITGQGVSRDNVEFLAQSNYGAYVQNAILRVKQADVGKVDAIVKAASDAAAKLTGISLQSTNVSYTLKDCTPLEKAAMQAAVEDAKARATTFAGTLGVSLGNITGASNYSYAPFGGTSCGSYNFGPMPMAGIAYMAGQSQQVQVVANISVTYGIK